MCLLANSHACQVALTPRVGIPMFASTELLSDCCLIDHRYPGRLMRIPNRKGHLCDLWSNNLDVCLNACLGQSTGMALGET